MEKEFQMWKLDYLKGDHSRNFYTEEELRKTYNQHVEQLKNNPTSDSKKTNKEDKKNNETKIPFPSIPLYDKVRIVKKVFETIDLSELDEVVDFLSNRDSLEEVVLDYLQKQKNTFQQVLFFIIGSEFDLQEYTNEKNLVIEEHINIVSSRVLKKYGSEDSNKSNFTKLEITKKKSWSEIQNNL